MKLWAVQDTLGMTGKLISESFVIEKTVNQWSLLSWSMNHENLGCQTHHKHLHQPSSTRLKEGEEKINWMMEYSCSLLSKVCIALDL